MRIEFLYRYPVKGLTAEALEVAEVEAGGCIPWDRAFALAQGDSGFDPDAPVWRQKANFLCQMKNARAAALFSFFDPRSGMLAIRAPDGSSVVENALEEAGRERIGSFLTAYMGDEARGTPRFHHVPGHSFCDQRGKVVSLINLASLRDFEAKVGARRHRRRFRANVWFSGASAWSERCDTCMRIRSGPSRALRSRRDSPIIPTSPGNSSALSALRRRDSAAT